MRVGLRNLPWARPVAQPWGEIMATTYPNSGWAMYFGLVFLRDRNNNQTGYRLMYTRPGIRPYRGRACGAYMGREIMAPILPT
jgi:hypothetical protein